MIKKVILSFVALTTVTMGAARANWEERPVYIDDGGRMTVTVRGGAAYGFGSVKNQLGNMMPELSWVDPSTGLLVTEQLDISGLPPTKKFSSLTWDSNVAVGFTIPHKPQVRIEANWEHIGETVYSAWPMFKGNLTTPDNTILQDVMSGGVYSTINSDIFTGMIYYDFFDGCVKPLKTFIPYIGAGIGYASSHTRLELTDPYGDLSSVPAMQGFGEVGSVAMDFYTSDSATGNFAASAAIGFSYGLMENLFIDAGIRVTYIPSIPFTLNNDLAVPTTGEKHREIFSVDNVIYTTASIGFRFEF